MSDLKPETGQFLIELPDGPHIHSRLTLLARRLKPASVVQKIQVVVGNMRQLCRDQRGAGKIRCKLVDRGQEVLRHVRRIGVV